MALLVIIGKYDLTEHQDFFITSGIEFRETNFSFYYVGNRILAKKGISMLFTNIAIKYILAIFSFPHAKWSDQCFSLDKSSLYFSFIVYAMSNIFCASFTYVFDIRFHNYMCEY